MNFINNIVKVCNNNYKMKTKMKMMSGSEPKMLRKELTEYMGINMKINKINKINKKTCKNKDWYAIPVLCKKSILVSKRKMLIFNKCPWLEILLLKKMWITVNSKNHHLHSIKCLFTLCVKKLRIKYVNLVILKSHAENIDSVLFQNF